MINEDIACFYGDNQSVEMHAHEAFEILLPYFDPVIRRYIRVYFAWGADREDLYQQGLIGLYKAIKAYDRLKGDNFKSFAIRCIRLNILNLVRADNAKKRLIHYGSYSLDRSINDNDRETIGDHIPSHKDEPLNALVEQENVEELHGLINELLTDTELNVLNLYLQEMSYEEIAECLCRSSKAVDNALQRVKRKIRDSLKL